MVCISRKLALLILEHERTAAEDMQIGSNQIQGQQKIIVGATP